MRDDKQEINDYDEQPYGDRVQQVVPPHFRIYDDMVDRGAMDEGDIMVHDEDEMINELARL